MSWSDDDENAPQTVGSFELLDKIGEGTYGIVYKAIDIYTKEIVVIKRTFSKNPSEIQILHQVQSLQHSISLRQVLQNDTYLVFPYCPITFDHLVSSICTSLPRVKFILAQILTAVEELHAKNIIHQDLKPNNMLWTRDGKIQLIDFGMAAHVTTKSSNTCQVITRIYRPPELLFGSKDFETEIDIWSIGCIFAEMMTREPYFPGDTDIQQLGLIFQKLGTPEYHQWQSAKDLPTYLEFTHPPPVPLHQQFPLLDPTGVDLLQKLLSLDPTKRISAQEALKHEFFHSKPVAEPPQWSWPEQESERTDTGGGRTLCFN